ncbi:protein LURP-one-related 11-like [Oryza brachyantha]|uniref:protein LURP-one-related 11-like n=1 Tax=Oryza brachyantha TaxID=4533 RepID=UPI001ADCD95E|nr:protein LURP-one-related 11-like [Oryza brachyantha]
MALLRLPSVKLWRAMVRVHSSCSSSPSPTPSVSEKLEEAGAPPRWQPTAASTTKRHWSEQREVFTIWMKSLVLNGSGCTVYDSGGRIVYRVDNYSSRSAADVCVMDLAGNVVVQILKRRSLGHLVGRWDGYRCRGSGGEQQEETPPPTARPWFKVVSKAWRGGGGPCCEFRSDADGRAVRYRMVDGARRRRLREAAAPPHAGCRIVDGATGAAVAEVRRKTTTAGVALGDDVLTLVVEPNVEHSLILALLLVHA